MVSDSTKYETELILRKNDLFNMQENQIIIIKQELVPCFKNIEGQLAITNDYKLIMKPHGNGDVHTLIRN